uniref:Uromodulin like 1 n=1 Tax=Leptobrachium leishanense TaxID=445787 RepID=A0A8C5LZ37_9ANUR
MVAFQKPYDISVPCGGWIPWKLCTKTYYKTEYHPIEVPEMTQVQQCCRGYERVGHYCVISSERYSELNRKPGICPSDPKDHQAPECTSDFDCPGLLKCCLSPKDSFCGSPVPPALDRNTIKYWYNGTITIKTEYQALQQLDASFFNHSRLLHSMITGELNPLEVSVYHLSTGPASMFTVQSQVLIGIKQPHSMMDIRMNLTKIVIRVPEVISIMIKDVDECLHPELRSCLLNETCINLNGSHKCTELTADRNVNPTYPRNESKDCSVFTNHGISNVTASGFHIHWNTNCPYNYTYRVHVTTLSGFNYTNNTRGTYMNMSGLSAGERYTVNISFQGRNGQEHSWTANVKTDAQMLNGTLRIVNFNLTAALRNKTSEEYLIFVRMFIQEVKKSLSHVVAPEMVTVKIVSLHSGSIIVNFLIIINDTKLLNNVTSASLSSMTQSSVFAIDPNSILLADFNECLSPLDNDCNENAVCKNLNVSYTCECVKPYIDMDPTRPGRNCEVTTVSTTLPLTTVSTTLPLTTVSTTLPLTTVSTTLLSTAVYQDPGSSATSTSTTDASPTTKNVNHVTEVLGMSTVFHNLISSTLEMTPSTDNLIGNTKIFNMTTMLPVISTTRIASSPQDFKTHVMNTSPAVDHSNDSSVAHTKESLPHSTTGNHATETSSAGSSTPDFPKHKEQKETSTSGGNNTSPNIPMTTSQIPTRSTLEDHHTGGGSTDSVNVTNKPTSKVTTGNTNTHNSTYVAPPISQPLIGETRETTTTTKPVTTRYITTPTTPKLQTEVPFQTQTHTTTTKTPLPLDMTLKDASNITCEVGKISISIQRAFLKMMSITESSLYLGSPRCTISNRTDTQVSLQSKWEECGTEVHNNKTHTVVNTTLYINFSSTYQNFIQTPKPIGNIRCMFHNDILLSTGYNPPGGFYTVIENLQGDGIFTPEFQLYIGDQPISPNFTLSASDDVKVQIRIKTEDPQFKVVISECWATPTYNSQDPVSFPFIRNSCALTNTYTVIHTNGEANNASFQTKIFSFVDNSVVYLHCRLHVCKEGVAGTCKPSCSDSRASRNSENVLTSLTRMGPLHQSRRQQVPTSEEPHLGPGYIALIIIGIFAFVAATVAVLVCWHERRTGNYNFKMKTIDIGYRAFSN